MSYTIIQLMDCWSNLMNKKEPTMISEVMNSQVENNEMKDDNQSKIENYNIEDHRMDLLFSNINGL